MKVEESPLDVLSRAASIVQSEEKSPKQNQMPPLVHHHHQRQQQQQQQQQEGSWNKLGKIVEERKEKSGRRSPKRSIIQSQEGNKKLKLEMTEQHQEESTKTQMCNSLLPPPPYTYNHPVNFQDCSPILPPYTSYFPRPSVISTSHNTTYSKYTEHYSKSKSCSCCKMNFCTTTFSYSHKEAAQKTNVTEGFVQPTVDDHFRKSLGDKYETANEHSICDKPSSVDEHFEKALGQMWYSLESGKCNST